jgi:hypothetical protein
LSSINKFFEFNLINYHNLINKIESYKDVMAIDSVYEYRFANSAFKTMNEFILTIFKTPLENYIYFDYLNKKYSYNIILNIYKEIEKNSFFEDIINLKNDKINVFFLQFLRFFSRLTKLRIYSFKFFLL